MSKKQPRDWPITSHQFKALRENAFGVSDRLHALSDMLRRDFGNVAPARKIDELLLNVAKLEVAQVSHKAIRGIVWDIRKLPECDEREKALLKMKNATDSAGFAGMPYPDAMFFE